MRRNRRGSDGQASLCLDCGVLKAGAQRAWGNGRTVCDGCGRMRREEGDGADRWAPSVSDWERGRRKTGRVVLRWAAEELG